MSQIKVDYIDHMGSDLSPVNAARVSFGKHSEALKPEDIKLIKYLADNKHLGPFEHQSLTVKITCPLAIRSQIMRHRTMAYNEISRRYTSENIEFYMPEMEDFRKQAASNRQASSGNLSSKDSFEAFSLMQQAYDFAEAAYERLLEMGLCREQARFVLPSGMMTEFYMTGNLRNWVHFLKLRLDGHAQKEAQDVAELILFILREKFPHSLDALMAAT